jgi:hypothetical protein
VLNLGGRGRRTEAETAVGSGFINASCSPPRLDCTFGFLVLAIASQIDDNRRLVLLSLISRSSAQSAITGAQFRGALSGGVRFFRFQKRCRMWKALPESGCAGECSRLRFWFLQLVLRWRGGFIAWSALVEFAGGA